MTQDKQSLSQEAVRDEALDDIGQTRNRVGSIFLEAVEKTVFPDNLAIALCSYFERHIDRPENDPQTEHGWGEWAEQKTNEALDLIIRALKREPNASYSELGRDDDAPRRDFEREQYERAEREPNAAGQASGSSEHTVASANPAPAAPDVASVVKRINDQFDECCAVGGHWDRMRDVALEAAALLARLGQGWIPVKDKLPPEYPVLCLHETGAMYVGEWNGPPHYKTTHWMPLPPVPGASDD